MASSPDVEWVLERTLGGPRAAGQPTVTPDPDALQLFCLPYAGGGAAVFHGWQAELGPRVRVLPLLLPGRDRRLREPLARDARELATRIAEGIAPRLDRPYALFGHSMGALLSFEVARRCAELGCPAPVHLFAAAFRAPHLADRNRQLHPLPEDEFIEAIDALEGTPREVLEHEALLQLLLPTLRADMELVETWSYSEGERLDCPITAFGSDRDPIVSMDELEGWREHTRGPVRTARFAGGHFFLAERRTELLAEVANDLGT